MTETGNCDVPEICTRCGNYRPQFYRVMHLECAVGGSCRGVKDNRCGAWCKRVEAPKTTGPHAVKSCLPYPAKKGSGKAPFDPCKHY